MKLEKADSIVEVARKVFAKHGYQKTSMDDIAREAMIGKGSIYYHFPSKEDLFIAVLSKFQENMASVLREALDRENTFEGKLRAYIITTFENFIANHDLIMQIIHNDSPIFMQKFTEFKQEFISNLDKLRTYIFDFGLVQGAIKDKYVDDIEQIKAFVARFLFMSKERAKHGLTDEIIAEIRQDHLMFAEMVIHLIKK